RLHRAGRRGRRAEVHGMVRRVRTDGDAGLALHRDPAPALQAPGTTLSDIVVGQRYLSDAEPELGLGVVVDVDERSVELAFAASDEPRRYVPQAAPLRRVRFAIGDTVTDDAGHTHLIEAVEEHGGLLLYRSAHGEVNEGRVAARTAVAGPRERLVAG